MQASNRASDAHADAAAYTGAVELVPTATQKEESNQLQSYLENMYSEVDYEWAIEQAMSCQDFNDDEDQGLTYG